MPDDFQHLEDEFLKRLELERERYRKLSPEEQEAENRRRKAASMAAVIASAL